MIRSLGLAVLGLSLCSCGVYGAKGNDTGGIIPWSPEAEASAIATANASCANYNKRAVLRTVRRVYGDYITYDCVFDGPLRRLGPG